MTYLWSSVFCTSFRHSKNSKQICSHPMIGVRLCLLWINCPGWIKDQRDASLISLKQQLLYHILSPVAEELNCNQFNLKVAQKTPSHLGVEATDGNSSLPIAQPQERGEVVHAGPDQPLPSWPAAVEHSVQRGFHSARFQTERGRAVGGEKKKQRGGFGFDLNEERRQNFLLPILVQQQEGFSGRRL